MSGVGPTTATRAPAAIASRAHACTSARPMPGAALGRDDGELLAEHGLAVQQEARRADDLAVATREAVLQRRVGAEAEAGEDLDRARPRLGRLDHLRPRAQRGGVAHGRDLEPGRRRIVERQAVEHGAHDHGRALGARAGRDEALAQVGRR